MVYNYLSIIRLYDVPHSLHPQDACLVSTTGKPHSEHSRSIADEVTGILYPSCSGTSIILSLLLLAIINLY